MAHTITDKQREVFNFLKSYIEENGRSPSYEEIKEEIGVNSSSSIQKRMKGLEERGWIKVLPHKARSIEIIHESSEDDLKKSIRRHLDALDVRVKEATGVPAHLLTQFVDDVRKIVK